MARNPENYPLTLSIPKDSALYRALLADGKRSGTKQYGVLAQTRLATYYEWEEQGLVSLLTKLLNGGRIEVREVQTISHDETTQTVTKSKEMSLTEILDTCQDAEDAFPD